MREMPSKDGRSDSIEYSPEVLDNYKYSAPTGNSRQRALRQLRKAERGPPSRRCGAPY